MGDLLLWRKTNQEGKAMATRSNFNKKKTDEDESLDSRRGKKPNQKLKPYLVLQILMENTDEAHIMSAADIVAALDEMGIYAERRSIYTDIEEINKALYMQDQGCTIQEAAEVLDDPDEGEEAQFIAYQELGRKEKGYYVRRRKYDLLDLRLLAECAYSTRFLTQGQSDHLINDVICEYASKHQRDQIKHDAFLTDRVKTVNKAMLRNLETINGAMSYGTRVNPHDPEKIKIVYVKRVMKQEGIRTTEKTITVSPYKLMINDGNYYLLAYNGKRLGSWRVDRIKEVTPTGEPRDCDEEFKALDLSNYAQCNFGMMVNTKKVRVKFNCEVGLLDTMLDRFGTKGVFYAWIDDEHFSCEPVVELNHQFYGWVCGFGESLKIETPEIAERYAAYLARIHAMY